MGFEERSAFADEEGATGFSFSLMEEDEELEAVSVLF